jgi:hypothetical protein
MGSSMNAVCGSADERRSARLRLAGDVKRPNSVVVVVDGLMD